MEDKVADKVSMLKLTLIGFFHGGVELQLICMFLFHCESEICTTERFVKEIS